jgi:hypothetical protein
MMFHWQDNVFFGRRKDGSVRVLKFNQEQWAWIKSEINWPDVEGEYPSAEIDLTIPDNHWGSIVASVSHAGEEDGRWYEAMEFHNGKLP